MRTGMTIVFFLALSAVNMNAQIRVKDYRATIAANDKTEITNLRLYISGMGEGILWANSEATREKIGLLFCQPDKLHLGADNYLDIINGQISRLSQPNGATKAELDDFAIGLLLLKGMQQTFPCGPRSQ